MFRAFFPGSDAPLDATPAIIDPPAGERNAGSMVLVVDDEEMVRDVVRMMIESFGFSVIAAGDGMAGIRAVKEHPAIKAVLLDMTMPRMSGEETFREIHRLRPELPVVLVSGYNEQEVSNLLSGKGVAGFIQKPFQLAALEAKLQQALHGASA